MVNTQCAHCLSQWVFLAVDHSVHAALLKEERWLDPYDRATVEQQEIPRLPKKPTLTLIHGQLDETIEHINLNDLGHQALG